jgi:hypothetical protein
MGLNLLRTGRTAGARRGVRCLPMQGMAFGEVHACTVSLKISEKSEIDQSDALTPAPKDFADGACVRAFTRGPWRSRYGVARVRGHASYARVPGHLAAPLAGDGGAPPYHALKRPATDQPGHLAARRVAVDGALESAPEIKNKNYRRKRQ